MLTTLVSHSDSSGMETNREAFSMSFSTFGKKSRSSLRSSRNCCAMFVAELQRDSGYYQFGGAFFQEPNAQNRGNRTGAEDAHTTNTIVYSAHFFTVYSVNTLCG